MEFDKAQSGWGCSGLDSNVLTRNTISLSQSPRAGKKWFETQLQNYSSCKTLFSGKNHKRRRVLGRRSSSPPTHSDQRGACQLTRASTIKTGVMGNASVINSREGNEVTVDSQFSQRKLAFITHLILRSKQVSCARLSRGIWQLLFAETIILMWRRERNSKK